MNQRSIILLVIVAAIIGGIYFFESMKVRPPSIVDTPPEVPLASQQVDGLEDIGEVEKVPMPEDMDEEDLARIREKGRKYLRAPELMGISGYINAEPGTKLADFRGKVVLIDFWTYSCINCIRTLPFLTTWHDRYKDRGLVILGVHTPEFKFEQKRENVVEAMDKHGVDYRVVQDNDYLTWRAFKNRYWPRKYLIDGDGFIRYDHIGEGAYRQTELKIQELLGELGHDVADMGIAGIADTTPRFRQTAELYAGYGFALPRGQNIGNTGGMRPAETIQYTLPDKIKEDRIYLEGKWLSNEENLEAQEEGVSIVLNYISTAVNIVATPLDGGVEMDVFIDGEYVTDKAGDDVIVEDARSYVVVDVPRLYNIVRGEYGRATLKLTVNSKDYSFNAFTFG